MTTIARRTINTEAHIIICGFGRSGQNLARLLEAEKIAYIALDLDPDRVRQAAAAGQSVVFGDAARLESLMAAGLARASAVVVSYHDTPSALKILHLVHSHAPKVPVVVRTIDDADFERLRAAGATEVVPEAIEGSLMLASHALALDHARLLSVTLPRGSGSIDRSLGEQALPTRGVAVVSLRRASGAVLQPGDSLVLAAGDTLVLSGLPEQLALAEAALLTPGRAGGGPGLAAEPR